MASKVTAAKKTDAAAPAGRKSQPVRVDSAGSGKQRHSIPAGTLLSSTHAFVMHGPVYLMFISAFAMLVYSFFASKDIIVMAPLTLQRQAVTIQAVSGGLVESVEVAENSIVSAGDPLATIQEKIRAASTPEQEAFQRQIDDLQLQERESLKEFEFRSNQLELDRRNLSQRRATEQGAIDNRIRQIEIQVQTAQRTRMGLDEDLGNARHDLSVKQELFANRDIPQVDFQRAQARVSDLQRAVGNADAEIQTVKLALETARSERQRLHETFSQERLDNEVANLTQSRERDQKLISDRILDLNRRLAESRTLVPGVHYEADKAIYSSLEDGIVTAVNIPRGAIISPGTPMFTVVRNTAPLEAHVMVQNKDIGKIKRGQKVQIKYFAYPYQEYGIQHGVIADIATKASGPNAMYQITVALELETITARKATVSKALEIGLEGVGEVKTGEKRFIELLFAPASRFFRVEEE
jgi:hemolysin D